jgi:16S rRNA (adenine1518-N6/adenine1519-N6)-dimethyltransferase
VDSAVLRLDRSPLSDDPALLQATARVADAAFAQRRKTIRNSLRASLGMDPVVLERALGEAGVDGSVRAETLSAERFIGLARALGSSHTGESL